MNDSQLHEIARAISRGVPTEPRAARLQYGAASGEWSLWWPCAACGGSTIPLLASLDADELDSISASVLEHIEAQPCPGCLSSALRAQVTVATPVAWYDTVLQGWVMRVPHGTEAGAILPLEIRWYDVPQALVQIAAAQALHVGD